MSAPSSPQFALPSRPLMSLAPIQNYCAFRRQVCLSFHPQPVKQLRNEYKHFDLPFSSLVASLSALSCGLPLYRRQLTKVKLWSPPRPSPTIHQAVKYQHVIHLLIRFNNHDLLIQESFSPRCHRTSSSRSIFMYHDCALYYIYGGARFFFKRAEIFL